MNILALETSTKTFSICLSQDGKPVHSCEAQPQKVLSESIIPTIEKLLKDSNIPLSKVDVFAIGLGPGSFTSLRVGLATIKGFCLATQKNVVGIGSLDLIAQNVCTMAQKEICVVTDAKRQMVYGCVYRVKNGVAIPQTKYILAPIEDVLKKVRNDVIVVGDGATLYKKEILKYFKERMLEVIIADDKYFRPKADVLCQLAHARTLKKKFDNIDKLVPFYLYPEDCQVR